MPSKRPRPDELEPIERASRDELRALQLTRMQWSLKHAYDNVPHYRKAFDAKGVKPADLKAFRANRYRASTRLRARPASQRWWDIRVATSTPGLP